MIGRNDPVAADGALSARKCTYRLRKENGVSVITLKTPGEGYARGEWAWEGEYLDEAPEKLAGLGAPEELVQLLREAEPVIVCGAKFTRITALLHLDGADCEICGDIGSLIGGGRQAPLCKLAFFNAAVLAAYAVLLFVLVSDTARAEFREMGKAMTAALLLGGNIVFLLYDFVLRRLRPLYVGRLQPVLRRLFR